MLLARTLSVEQFGTFASALAIASLMVPLAGFGLEGYWLSIFGREGQAAKRWMPPSIRFVFISAALVLSGISAWAWLGPHNVETTIILLILTIFIIGQVTVVLASAKYQLEGRHGWLAIWQLLPNLLRFLGVLAVIFLMGRQVFTATSASIIFALVGVILLGLGGYQLVRFVHGKLVLEGHSEMSLKPLKHQDELGMFQVLAGTWPFGLAGIFYLIYFQSDIILIKYLIGDSAAGIYSVAFVVMSAIYLFPSVLYQKFLLPRLHRWAHHDKLRLINAYRIGNVGMSGLGIIAMVMLWLLAPLLVPFIFGEAYDSAVTLLMILAAAIPFRFFASSAGAMLVTGDGIKIKVKLMGLAAGLNVILNLAFIPKFGIEGAAIATVITELFLAIMYQFAFKRYLITDKGFLD